jgi:outer membrane protein with beta-barrel domain
VYIHNTILFISIGQSNMKRFILLLAMLLAYSGISHAQVLITLLFGDKLNSPNMEFGLHAGANISTLSNLEGARYTSNLNLGFFFDIKLTEKLSLHPELLVKATSGAKGLQTYAIGDPDFPELDEILLESDLERQIGYFQLPILIKYKIKYGFAVEAGIQPALRTNVKDVFTDKFFEKEDFKFKYKRNKEFNVLDFGLTAGISWRPRKDQKGMTIFARFTLGLVDTLKDNPGEPQKNRAFAIGALVPIGVKKAEAARAAKEAEEKGE